MASSQRRIPFAPDTTTTTAAAAAEAAATTTFRTAFPSVWRVASTLVPGLCMLLRFGEIWFKENMILFAFMLLKVSIFERRAGSGAAGDRKIKDF